MNGTSNTHAYGLLKAADWTALAACRALPDWEVLPLQGDLWVRRPLSGEALEAAEEAWKPLPFQRRYRSAEGDRLLEEGARVPSRRVPEGRWLALASFIGIEARPARMPGALPSRLAFQPVRLAAAELPASLHLVAAADWLTWAVSALAPRLAPLRYAASSDGRVCVLGQPPPPLPGQAWVLWGRIALPAGFGFPEGLVPEWMAETLALNEGDLALWHPDGRAEVLPAAAFLPATRANVRATSESLSEDWLA